MSEGSLFPEFLPKTGFADTKGPCPICKHPGTYVDIGAKGDSWEIFARAWARIGDHVTWWNLHGTLYCMDWPDERTRRALCWGEAEQKWLYPALKVGDLVQWDESIQQDTSEAQDEPDAAR